MFSFPLPINKIKPKSIMPAASESLHKAVEHSLAMHMRKLQNEHGFDIYVVKQNRGRCYPVSRVITIPLWVCTGQEQDRRQWYVAHEIAHAYNVLSYGERCWHDNIIKSHGDEFMEQLIRICPAKYLHYETSYKPRNSAQNGISQNKIVNTIIHGGFKIPADF